MRPKRKHKSVPGFNLNFDLKLEIVEIIIQIFHDMQMNLTVSIGQENFKTYYFELYVHYFMQNNVLRYLI